MTQEDLNTLSKVIVDEHKMSWAFLNMSRAEQIDFLVQAGFKKTLELLQKRRNNLSIDSTECEEEAWTALLHPFTHLLD